MNRVYVVGIGPGAGKQMTEEAREVLNACDTIIGYTVYVDLVKEQFPEKEFLTTPMKQEVKRCKMAFEEAMKGKKVAMTLVLGYPNIKFLRSTPHKELDVRYM